MIETAIMSFLDNPTYMAMQLALIVLAYYLGAYLDRKANNPKKKI